MEHFADHVVPGRTAVIMMAFGNASAWLHSFVENSVSVGAVVTVCTIAVPAVGGAVVYFTKNVFPVVADAWLGYKERKDKMQTTMLSGQMERLNQNLEAAKEQGEAASRLADTASMQADRLQAMLEQSEASNADFRKSLAEIKSRLEDANRKLHDERNQAASYEATIGLLRIELDEYRSRLGPVIDQAAANKAAIESTAVRVDELGAKVSHAAEALAEAVVPTEPEVIP